MWCMPRLENFQLPRSFFMIFLLSAIIAGIIFFLGRQNNLKKIIDRLSADSRIAEVVVTKSELDEKSGKILTTIKFLEYDSKKNPLKPKYFTFRGNIIQFQALVIRFDDRWIKAGDRLKGKSIYLFMKAFVLDKQDTQIFEITPGVGVPEGYRASAKISRFEAGLWKKFWAYALNPDQRKESGIKSAQIEAPGSMFLPGTIYTLQIEHDGGIRIDTQPIPKILQDEKVA